MTKEQVLDLIAKIDWQRDSWKKSEAQDKIEQALGKYVVYSLDPDSYRGYGYEYYLTKKEALADYESRTTSYLHCYCVIAEVDGDWSQQRTMGRRLEPWE